MIAILIDLLKQDKFHGISEEIDTAKGKFSIPQTYTEALKQTKRELKWKLSNR